jgi:tetratricopeptide (TPR) repeat protein
LKPAQEILGYAHEMLGKIAFDQLAYPAASGHFQEMLEIGEELRDPDLIALAMIHQGDVLRRRGRFELAVTWLERAELRAQTGSPYTNGLRWMTLARAYAEFDHKQAFQKAIDQAQEIVTTVTPSLDATNNQFNVVGVLQERAQGYTLLGEPERALDVYQESARVQPFRPMRDQGVFVILQAQAHAYAGDIPRGVDLAVQGLQLARGYQSERHVSRVQRMYDRLSVTPMGTHPQLRDLREALRA